ncbi:MAG TPA: DUF2339 domain-containing protein [Allosphingosinicella sp.]|jgi:uncharacterized membrane protein
MEFLITLMLIGAVIFLFAQNSSLKVRLRAIEWRLDEGGSGLAVERVPAAAGTESAARDNAAWPPADAEIPVEAAASEWPEPAAPEPAPEPADTETTPAMALAADDGMDRIVEEGPGTSETLGALFEKFVAGKLLIWVGGVALMVAGFLLVRYSIEMGLMTPRARMIGAGVFGLTLLAAGEYARAGRFADDPRIAQALVGAGLAVLFGTAYGSHVLYGLIGTATASGLMLAVTFLALVLSLRHGAPTAILGLVGGFLTPALVGDENAGAVPLLSYLALLDFTVFLIAWRRGWTWLAAAAVALSFVWAAYVLTRPPDDAMAGGLFVVVLSLAGAVIRPGKGRQLAIIQPLAIGIIQLTALVGRYDIGLPGWILFFALSGAAMILSVLRSEYRLAPPLALGFALLLLFGKSTTEESLYLVPWAAEGITILFGVVGLGLAVWKRNLYWALIACVGIAAPLMIVRGMRPDWLSWTIWGLLAAAAATGPALLVWVNRARARIEAPADLLLLAAAGTSAGLLIAAVWDLVLIDWAPAGWLAIGVLVSLAARRLGDLALGIVAAFVAIVAIVECFWLTPTLSRALASSLFGEPVLAVNLPDSMHVLALIAVPAILLAAMRLALPPLPLGARRATGIMAGLFAAAAAYVWFKQVFGLASYDDYVARGMIERTILNQFLFASGWLLASGRVRLPRIERDLVMLAGTLLTFLATVRLIGFDMLFHNPAFVDQWVGPWPVLNLILPAFLLSAIWLYAARRGEEDPKLSGPWLAAFLAALLVGVALMVRQGFHGAILTGPERTIAEFYGYSLAGLVVAIGLLVAGMRLPDKALRLAGLVLLTATIFKVFLVDAAELEGVLRILSFLGLGVALIGIGRLYGPVLRAEREQPA